MGEIFWRFLLAGAQLSVCQQQALAVLKMLQKWQNFVTNNSLSFGA